MKRTNVTDMQIVQCFLDREERAITLTHEKYGSYLYTVAYNILHDALDCEECRNDTYLGLWNAIPPHQPQLLAPFAAKIMRRIALNRYEEKSRKKRIPSAMTISLNELHGALENIPPDRSCALSDLIDRFLRTLSERDRYIFICRYCYADSVENIAETMGVRAVSVYKRLEKIRTALKIYLEKEGEAI